jgi:hypothetical protein
MAGFVFNAGADGLQSGGSITWASDTIKVRPVTKASESAVDKDATSMTGIGTTGYDVTLGSKTKTKNNANDRIVYDSADFTFAAVAGAVGAVDHFIVFKYNTNDAGSTPIAKVAMTEITPNGGDIAVTVSADGLFYTQQ